MRFSKLLSKEISKEDIADYAKWLVGECVKIINGKKAGDDIAEELFLIGDILN